MIPILYDTNEKAFINNGIGRLRDCISCTVTEERNGIYECDFEYPVNGANYELIQIGRIIGVTHDDTGDVQPFDIVSFTKPINGVVTFHCTHISYRQSYYTFVPAKNSIQSISDAFTMFSQNVDPAPNPFRYSTDKTSTGYAACADGLPHSVRQMLGGIEGSLLDTYGGEYEFDKWNVILHSARGTIRDFSIRYGVNMLEYNDETNNEGAYSSCIPYWNDGETIVWGTPIGAGTPTITGRHECVPLDLTDKFENQPTATQLRNAAKAYMNSNQTFLPTQTINVSFVRLQDMDEFADFQNLLTCQLCDTINVIFPDYQTSGNFKIVKTVWNVLESRFDEMELGTLSTSLAEALGISNTLDRTGGGGGTGDYEALNNKPQINGVTLSGNKSFSDLGEKDYITAQGTTSGWLYRKWNSGKIELWANDTKTVSCTSAFASTGAYYSGAQTYNLPTTLGINSITHFFGSGAPGNQGWIMIASASTTSLSWRAYNRTSNSSCSVTLNFYVVGTYA